jgi:hypothetical protein
MLARGRIFAPEELVANSTNKECANSKVVSRMKVSLFALTR